MTAGSPPPDPGPETSLRRGFRVGDWDVHPLQGVIEQGGHRVHIEPKVMDVLVCLARHPGEVVTREMLLDQVWQGVVVTDDVVTRCISELRTVLRDTDRDRRFIRTIPKRGYSLLVPVEALANGRAQAGSPTAAAAPAGEPPAAPPSPVQWALDGAARAARQTVTTTRNLVRSALLGIGLIIVTVVGLAVIFGDGDGVQVIVDPDDEPDHAGMAAPSGNATASTAAEPLATGPKIRSVAVLPLVNLSGNPEHEYFSDGLAEDIRNALIGVTDLRVAARTSSVAFRDKPMDVREIARQLNVEALLEGTVRMSDTRLRVTTQLTDGRTGYPIWASSFERPVTDKLALQTEVAEAIIRQVAPSIARGDRLFAGATRNEQAHEAYLLGRYYWNQRTREGVERSINYFEQALARDPDYALAWSGLADAWSLLSDYADRPRAETGPKAREYAEKAVALDPGLAEARASLGMVLRNSGDLEGARVEYQKAVELEPGYSMAQMWLGVLMLGMGDANEAGRRYEAALQLDPLHPAVQINYLSALIARGDLDRAREEGRRLLTLTPNGQVQKMLWEVSLERGDYDEVLAQAVGQAGATDATPFARDAVIEALIHLQRFDEARRLLDENRGGMELPRRLSLEAGMAVAKRDPGTLRRVATQLEGPAAQAAIPAWYRGCKQQWIGLWLGIADLLEDQPAAAAQRFRSFGSSVKPVICEEETPALRLIAAAYALESEARLNGGRLPAGATTAARKEVEQFRALGWNDAWFNTADLAITILAGDEAGATTLLRTMRRRGLEPYGRMRSSSLFDRLWDLPALKEARPALVAEYEATRKRASDVKLAKLGL
ncbi:MAG: winged helix-turn-helix domain-containing protein [Chromatiales bacterium]|nr:winged helix-turn-helix domain-containing protein [Chromatiales bacterium]